MIRFLMAASLATILVSSPAEIVFADSQKAQSDGYPVIARFVLRDRKISIISASDGYLYSIADKSGTILSANLTEDQLVQQYPGLLELLKPGIANEEAELLMLAPIAN